MRLLACVAVLGALFCTPAAASYHSAPYMRIADETGITVQPLAHGQMAALETNRSAIVALAASVAADDANVQKLTTFVAQQRRACWWGVMPLALADVESPFHVCTHAYLAGTKALLMRVQQLAPREAQALADTVNAAMLADGTALEMCVNSATPFNTSEVATPRWEEVPHHAPTLAVVLAPLLLLGGLLLWRRPARLVLRTA